MISTLSAPHRKFRVVDMHFHLFNTDLQGKNGIPGYMPPSTVGFWLDLMDRGGVDRAFPISYNAEDIASEIRRRGESPSTVRRLSNTLSRREESGSILPQSKGRWAAKVLARSGD